MKTLKIAALLVAAVAASEAPACDTLQTFRSFAVPSYAPAFATDCGCGGVLQAPLYAPQVFSAPVYAPRVFAAPVYAPQVFAAPVFRSFAVQRVVVRQPIIRQRVVIRQRNVFGGGFAAPAFVPASGLSIRAPFFRLDRFGF